MSTTDSNTYSPDDLLSMPHGDRFELVGGKLMELEVSTWSSYVAGRIFYLLMNFCQQGEQGWVFPEGTSFQCFPDDPNKVRKPDVAFIQLSRLTSEQARREGHNPVAPDLAVEVLSPRDIAYDVDRKIEEYFAAGVQVIWVVNPDTRTVRVIHHNDQDRLLHEHDELDANGLLPGFRCGVREMFLAPGES